MDLSSLNKTLGIVSDKIKNYLDNPHDVELATYEQQLNVPYVANKYNEIVQKYSDVLKIITDALYFISYCKKACKIIGDNTALAKQQKAQIKAAIEIVEEQLVPIYNEEKRLKVIEMFYRNLFTRRDF